MRHIQMNNHQAAHIDLSDRISSKPKCRPRQRRTNVRPTVPTSGQPTPPTDTQRNNDATITSPLRQNDVGDVALTQRRRHHRAVCPPGAVHVAMSGARPRGPVPLTMFNRTRNPTKIEMLVINTSETTY